MSADPVFDGPSTERRHHTGHLADVTTPQQPRAWLTRLLTRMAWSDALIVAAAVLIAQWVRFGASGTTSVTTTAVSAVVIAAWLLLLKVFHTRDRRVVGSGATEYSRVVTASLSVFGAWAIVGLLFKLEYARGFIALALPLGTLGLLFSRWCWRRRLARERLEADNQERVVVVGSARSAAPLIERLAQDPSLGYVVVGVCVPPAESYQRSMMIAGNNIRVLGTFDDVVGAVQRNQATTVAVSSASAIGHTAMQDLSWGLEGLDVDMLVAPGVADVAGPRITVRPAAGLPLLHIDRPHYAGADRFRKAALDKVGASILLVVLAPVFVAVACAELFGSRGPIFDGELRIGLNNKPFRLWRFSTSKAKPSVNTTRLDALLWRYHLVDIPQLFNVLAGQMSLVGPRPPRPDQMAGFEGATARCMVVKPGITGLWQLSDSRCATWEEAARLDLTYVANWSVMQDLMILWRTVVAVSRQ